MPIPVALLALLLLFGILLFDLGRRGRVINDHPACTKCHFDLFGVYPAALICPECGSDLSSESMVRHGVRAPNRRMKFAGAIVTLLALVLGSGWGYTAATGADINRYLPTPWLIARASTSSPTAALKPLKELQRRKDAGELQRGHIAKLVDIALDHQSDDAKPWHESWGDFIESAYATGDLTDDAYSQFLRNAAVIEPEIRDTIREGTALPIKLATELGRGGAGTAVVLQSEITAIELDGQPVQRFGRSYSSTMLQPGGTGSSTSQEPIGGQPGDHVVRVVWKLARLNAVGSSAPPLDEWTLEQTAKVRILPADARIIELRKDAAARDTFATGLSIESATAARNIDGGVKVRISFRSEGRTLPIAMEAVLRSDPQEWSMGTFTFPAGDTTWSTSMDQTFEDFAATRCLLELRPSTKAAEGAVGYDAILGETVTLPVEMEWKE